MQTYHNGNLVNQVYYRDNVEIRNGDVTVNHSDGRIVYINGSGAGNYQYYLKDHLGNVRLTFSDKNNDGKASTNEVIAENHYYPFGLKMEGSWNSNNTATPEASNQYNGKEWVDDLGLGMNDYGARWYDPATARWSSVDPLAEKYVRHSGYNFVGNNPISNIEIDGRWWAKIDEKNNIVLVAERGDNANSLIEFLGGIQNAAKYVPRWAMNENIQYLQGSKVKLKSSNVYSDGVSWYNNVYRNNYDNSLAWKNGRCHTIALFGTRGQSIIDFPIGSLLNNFDPIARDNVIRKQYEALAKCSNGNYDFEGKDKFGSSILTFKGHTAIYFGTDNQGGQLFLSKHNAGSYSIDTYGQIKLMYGNPTGAFMIKEGYKNVPLTEDDLKP